MQPAFVKQLQRALDAGQVVLVPPPAKAPDQPPPRSRSESSLTAALCLLFKLTRSEGRVLAKLFLRDYGAKEDLQSATCARGATRATMRPCTRGATGPLSRVIVEA